MNIEILRKFLIYILSLSSDELVIVRTIFDGKYENAYILAISQLAKRGEKGVPDWVNVIANGNASKLDAVCDEGISDLIATWMTLEANL